MCEYSLHEVASRPAKVKDKLITIEFSSTHGFAAIGEHGAKLVIQDHPPKVAVCLLLERNWPSTMRFSTTAPSVSLATPVSIIRSRGFGRST